jgi:L,D-transpeptidase catalytic domain
MKPHPSLNDLRVIGPFSGLGYKTSMNRRTFGALALTGLGMAALPRSLARATAIDSSMLPPPNATLMPVAPKGPGKIALLEQAKAALDRHRAVIPYRDRVAIADFGIASRNLRFHIVDLISGQTNSYLVAHGKGSDPEHSGWLKRFSNDPGSLATSDGAYLTGQIYEGIHGASMRLIGLDADNSNAEPRAIVVHGADYVSEDHIATWGKVGRSEGCFAVARHMVPQVLGMLGPNRLLFAGKA